MSGLAQVKATIPRDLKRRAFAVLALREEKFNGWLRRELEALLQETEKAERQDNGIQKVHAVAQATGDNYA
jgi:hypothetical protein